MAKVMIKILYDRPSAVTETMLGGLTVDRSVASFVAYVPEIMKVGWQ